MRIEAEFQMLLALQLIHTKRQPKGDRQTIIASRVETTAKARIHAHECHKKSTVSMAKQQLKVKRQQQHVRGWMFERLAMQACQQPDHVGNIHK